MLHQHEKLLSLHALRAKTEKVMIITRQLVKINWENNLCSLPTRHKHAIILYQHNFQMTYNGIFFSKLNKLAFKFVNNALNEHAEEKLNWEWFYQRLEKFSKI
jgi:hypothetical protein